MNGEVIHALLGLLDQSVTEQFPAEFFGLAIYFFQCLINRYSADGYRTVANDPFAGFVNVLTGGQIHDGIRTPANAPGHLVHFFLDRRGDGRITQVAINLHQEIAADDHRFQLRVIDVGRNDGAPAGNFLPDEFWGNSLRQVRTPALAGMLFGQPVLVLFKSHVFAYCHVFHLGGDETLFGVMHLGHIGAGLGTARLTLVVFKTQMIQAGICRTLASVLGSLVGEDLGIAPLLDPDATDIVKAFANINTGHWVGIRAGGIVYGNRRIRFSTLFGDGIGQGNFPHGHTNIGTAALDINLAGIG